LLGLKDENLTGEFIALSPDTKTGQPRLVPVPQHIKPLLDDLNLPMDQTADYMLRKEFENARNSAYPYGHTYASLLAQASATLQLIGKAMGHSTPVMTNRYAHLISDNLLELSERFASLVASPKKRL